MDKIDDRTIILVAVIVILFTILTYVLFYVQKLLHKIDLLKANPQVVDKSQLILAAYERLTLFTERTKLDNLISKLYNSNYSAREMQQVLTNNIREEFEYNISQQLYIKPEIWNAITKMKEQNIYIVNQVTASMQQNASAMDLNKHIIELLQTNPNVTMNNVVLDALQFETKTLL